MIHHNRMVARFFEACCRILLVQAMVSHTWDPACHHLTNCGTVVWLRPACWLSDQTHLLCLMTLTVTVQACKADGTAHIQ